MILFVQYEYICLDEKQIFNRNDFFSGYNLYRIILNKQELVTMRQTIDKVKDFTMSQRGVKNYYLTHEGTHYSVVVSLENDYSSLGSDISQWNHPSVKFQNKQSLETLRFVASGELAVNGSVIGCTTTTATTISSLGPLEWAISSATRIKKSCSELQNISTINIYSPPWKIPTISANSKIDISRKADGQNTVRRRWRKAFFLEKL